MATKRPLTPAEHQLLWMMAFMGDKAHKTSLSNAWPDWCDWSTRKNSRKYLNAQRTLKSRSMIEYEDNWHVTGKGFETLHTDYIPEGKVLSVDATPGDIAQMLEDIICELGQGATLEAIKGRLPRLGGLTRPMLEYCMGVELDGVYVLVENSKPIEPPVRTSRGRGRGKKKKKASVQVLPTPYQVKMAYIADVLLTVDAPEVRPFGFRKKWWVTTRLTGHAALQGDASEWDGALVWRIEKGSPPLDADVTSYAHRKVMVAHEVWYITSECLKIDWSCHTLEKEVSNDQRRHH